MTLDVEGFLLNLSPYVVQSRTVTSLLNGLSVLCVGFCSHAFQLLPIAPTHVFVSPQSSCLQSVSIGWDGGVYVQTCGHTLHIDCHKSYMESLRVSTLPVSPALFSYLLFSVFMPDAAEGAF